jgi:hypothetical protein
MDLRILSAGPERAIIDGFLKPNGMTISMTIPASKMVIGSGKIEQPTKHFRLGFSLCFRSA